MDQSDQGALRGAGRTIEDTSMMGMGFLRLNKILAKHRWHRKENAADKDEEGEYGGSSFTLWSLVIVVLVLSILVFGVIHTRRYF